MQVRIISPICLSSKHVLFSICKETQFQMFTKSLIVFWFHIQLHIVSIAAKGSKTSALASYCFIAQTFACISVAFRSKAVVENKKTVTFISW